MASKYGWFVYRGSSDRLDVDGQLLVRDGAPARLPKALVNRLAKDKTVHLEAVEAPPDTPVDEDDDQDGDTPPPDSEVLGSVTSTPTEGQEPGSPGKE